MIPNPVAADVLDKAAEHVSETPIMPMRFPSAGAEHGDTGYDLRTAVVKGMSELHMLDSLEVATGTPHEAMLLEIVADYGTVPEMDPTIQWAKFDVPGSSYPRLEDIPRRDRRRMDIAEWARGRRSSEVANLLRWAAEDFRAKDPTCGVFDTLNADAHKADLAEAEAFYQHLIGVSDAARDLPPELDAMLQNPMDMLRRLFGGENPFEQ